VVITL